MVTLQLKSTAFLNGESIPKKFTREGEDLSPPLSWTGTPAGTKSLALIVDDPDAPDPIAPQVTWVHWVAYNIEPDVSGLQEGAASKHNTTAKLPAGMQEGLNDWKNVGYEGPNPPRGRHRYFHKLYALDTILEGLDNPTKAMLEAAMEGHVLDKTELIGTYAKSA